MMLKIEDKCALPNSAALESEKMPYEIKVAGRKIVYEKYKQLDGSNKVQVQRVGGGNIVKRFDMTPFPRYNLDVVCPHFVELKWAYGCPYKCAWCYLQGTLRMLKTKTAPVIKDYTEIAEHLDPFLLTKDPEMLNMGEVADSLMGERRDFPFSSFIIPRFQGTPHKALFLSKSDYVKNVLDMYGQENAVMSFTVNAPSVSKRWEKVAPSPDRRLRAARELAKRDYEVRLRVDPIVPIDGWKGEYKQLVRDIADVGVERITLGTLRGLKSTIAHARDKSWTAFFENGDNSGWGKKMSVELRYETYEYLLKELESAGIENVGVCKETIGMWKELGLDYKKIKCNCTL